MATSSVMTSTLGYPIMVKVVRDQNGKKCVTLQKESTMEYLTCMDNKKYLYWNEEKEFPWNWEHFYPLRVGENKYKFKSHFGTFFKYDAKADELFQCFSSKDTKLTFTGTLPVRVSKPSQKRLVTIGTQTDESCISTLKNTTDQETARDPTQPGPSNAVYSANESVIEPEEEQEPVIEPEQEPVSEPEQEPVSEPEEEPVSEPEEQEPVIEPEQEPVSEPEEEPVSEPEEQEEPVSEIEEPVIEPEEEQEPMSEPEELVEEPEVSDEESVTTDTDSTKTKRKMPESQKLDMAIGKKSRSIFFNSKWADVEADIEEELNEKDLKKAVNKKLGEMYKALSNEEKEEWRKEAIKVLGVKKTEAKTKPPPKKTTTTKKTTKKATQQPPTDSDNETESSKPKRAVSDEKKVAMALGRKARALFNNEKREEIEAQFPDIDKKAVNRKLTEIYSKLSKADKEPWTNRARELGVSDTEVFCPNNED